jgi:hypothetical protein
MQPTDITCVAVLVAVLVSPLASRAGEPDSCPNSGIGEDDACDHFEFTMGFLAGARDYSGESFSLAGDAEGTDGAAGLVEPFGGPPYDYVPVYGLRYDVRLVVSHVRMTVGVDFPFAHLPPAVSLRFVEVGGVEREVLVRRIRPYELRFGIGGEIPFGRVTPFLDLVGEVDWVSTELAIDSRRATFEANSFGFSARGGARVYLRDWFFISGAGEIGIVGNRFWGAELSLGFAFG